MTVRGKWDRLNRQLGSWLTPSGRHLRDLQAAQGRFDLLQDLQQRLLGTEGLLGDPAYESLVNEELSAIEETLDEAFSPTIGHSPEPPEVEPAANTDVGSYLNERIVWRLGSIDLAHPKDWERVEAPGNLKYLLDRLKALETYTWKKLPQLSKSNHRWEDPSVWEKPSLNRLAQLNLTDQSGWYQVQLDGRGRLIGFREGAVFNVVWWDRDHEVYLTKKKRKSQKKSARSSRAA